MGMSDNHFTGRLTRFADVAAAFGPLTPVRPTFRDRLRMTAWIWRL